MQILYDKKYLIQETIQYWTHVESILVTRHWKFQNIRKDYFVCVLSCRNPFQLEVSMFHVWIYGQNCRRKLTSFRKSIFSFQFESRFCTLTIASKKRRIVSEYIWFSIYLFHSLQMFFDFNCCMIYWNIFFYFS